MKSAARLCLGLIVFSSFLAVTACGDDDDDTPQGGAGTDGAAGSSASNGGGGTLEPGHGGRAGEAHGGGGHGEGALICEVLGTLCHEADTGSGMGHDCHQLGHVGNVETCEENFAGCIGFCVEGASGDGGAGGGTSADQDPKCAAIGSLCHPIEAGIGQECHDLGHEGDTDVCAERFDECATFCLAELDKLEHGAGGAGGQSGSSGGAGGAN